MFFLLAPRIAMIAMLDLFAPANSEKPEHFDMKPAAAQPEYRTYTPTDLMTMDRMADHISKKDWAALEVGQE